ncbi:MAG: acyl-phosphate glycerol 3-phosphate acyltransferase [Bacteroidetes bacterium QS_8_64_10]|nr:MAG: acyl-phosphate glycerol 3-phosphate acyltransferase [Bacteroidetes bacterium QS_8_64_10]
MLHLLLILVLSYLIGAIPGSLWSGKLIYGVDVREHGSGNAGATNAFRVLGWKAGVIATVVDLGKGITAAGVIPYLIGMGVIPHWGLVPWELQTVVCLAAGVAAIVGHMFPIYARFEGGKGVNTAAGVLVAVTPVTTLIAIGIFLAVLIVFRYVSLASITAAVAFPSTVAIRRYLFDIGLDPSLLLAHRGNIRRLLNGTESRISSFRPARGMIGKDEL